MSTKYKKRKIIRFGIRGLELFDRFLVCVAIYPRGKRKTEYVQNRFILAHNYENLKLQKHDANICLAPGAAGKP